ncbi:hypothetical protein RCL1_000962 [Eukaryota sp. TZLM3-RCL]
MIDSVPELLEGQKLVQKLCTSTTVATPSFSKPAHNFHINSEPESPKRVPKQTTLTTNQPEAKPVKRIHSMKRQEPVVPKTPYSLLHSLPGASGETPSKNLTQNVHRLIANLKVDPSCQSSFLQCVQEFKKEKALLRKNKSSDQPDFLKFNRTNAPNLTQEAITIKRNTLSLEKSQRLARAANRRIAVFQAKRRVVEEEFFKKNPVIW